MSAAPVPPEEQEEKAEDVLFKPTDVEEYLLKAQKAFQENDEFNESDCSRLKNIMHEDVYLRFSGLLVRI